jgi:hypothetical protein
MYIKRRRWSDRIKVKGRRSAEGQRERIRGALACAG